MSAGGGAGWLDLEIVPLRRLTTGKENNPTPRAARPRHRNPCGVNHDSKFANF
jgi:hypothetical protein